MNVKMLLVSCFSIVGSLASTIRADVLIVEDIPGAEYSTIQSAVHDAEEGDLVLVKVGQYHAFTVTNKSLTIVADEGHVVTVSGRIRIRNLSSEKRVSLIGLDSGFGLGMPRGQLLATNNKGSIRVLNSSFIGLVSGAGVFLKDNLDVAFSNCVIKGGPGDSGTFFDPGPGGSGIKSNASLSALYNSSVSGGVGGSGSYGYGAGGNGGHALDVDSGLSFASGSVLIGGDGGYTDDFLPVSSGDGGDAIFTTKDSRIRLLDTTQVGGKAGATTCCTIPGSDGVPFGGNGMLVDYGFDSRSIQMPVPVRDGTTQQLQLSGNPGDLAFLFLSDTSRFTSLSAYSGVQLADADSILYQGIIPSSGVRTKTIKLNALSDGLSSLQIQAQSIFLDTSLNFVLGSHTEIIVLSSDL